MPRRNSPLLAVACALGLLASPGFCASNMLVAASTASAAPAPAAVPQRSTAPFAAPPMRPPPPPLKSTATATTGVVAKSTITAGGLMAAKSTAAADAMPALVETPMTIADVYNGTGMRDPFVSLLGASMQAPEDTETPPNIHNLVLRGVITGHERLAMIEDTTTGLRYVLKANGKLYSPKDKPVPGIDGAIKSGSSVLITTAADKDVQWLTLGEKGAD